MKLKLFLRNLLSLEPKFLIKPEFKIVHAFTINAVRYFKAEDPFNNPYKRALMAVSYYDEFNRRVSREYLGSHLEGQAVIMKNLRDSFKVSSSKIDLNKIFDYISQIEKTNRYLKERMEFIIDDDLLYKLASVIFFDESESPYDYDMDYNRKKIESWKKKVQFEEFISQMPIIELVPYLQGSEIDFQIYLQQVGKLKGLQSQYLTSLKSKSE
jgi:hypothetical protein